ncbi:MAG: D-alanyl-D-alanine carboxypeptidase [Desulfobacterales bacterium]|jgi:D-alanyl-D-alanine carboxypeptidase/D-alanyl-D-alanine-endopeptidase (penicillin-binding protein 4)
MKEFNYFASRPGNSFKSAICIFLILFCFFQSVWTKNLRAQPLDKLNNYIGSHDAILVVNPNGRIVFSKNAGMQLVPASVLKIYTALVALHYLGPEYRFPTEFYKDQRSNIKIKGYGDPLLISEMLMEIVTQLTSELDPELRTFNDLVLDGSYFKNPALIPGVASTFEPYDAPNGALCVNFNTVNFRRDKNGAYVSAEAQTPLLPFALSRISASAMGRGRIILSPQKNEFTRYAGHLFLYFLKNQGIKSKGIIRMGRVNKKIDKLIFRYRSGFSFIQVVSKLLEYSNNFIANQLLIATGAKVYGPPGTLEKGIRSALTYAKNTLKIENLIMVEGSGISRGNRISAKSIYKILVAFEPYHAIMRRSGKSFYKTGTLKGIHTRAGYIENAKGELYYFVVLLNTPGKSTEPIMDLLLRSLNTN